MEINKDIILNMLNDESTNQFGCFIYSATEQQAYKTVCSVVRDILMENKRDSNNSEYYGKQIYYLSMEFLVGRSLKNNLYNLGLEKTFTEILQEIGIDIQRLYETEPDAGLGNGGLGRLASCYMDSLTTQNVPVTGFSIRYEFGIFKQKIIGGWQMELPDDWLNFGDVWLIRRNEDSVEVKFGGAVEETAVNGKFKSIHKDYKTVIAVPYDMLISGYKTGFVNKLVLWSAKSLTSMDLKAFSRGEYMKSLEENTMAEVISKVLYPADDHVEGKILRIKQQYLLVSASIQSIVKDHLKKYNTLNNLPEKVSIHINDTHPALSVPELMRILIDEYDYDWDTAWNITCKTLSYTNHTTMSEALERWNVNLFERELPRIYKIIYEINRRLMIKLSEIYPNDYKKHEYMAVIAQNEIRMYNLCLCSCHKVNGVSKLHSDILKNSIFRDYYNIQPNKFTNVTNGIAYRRWLCQANPLLCDLLNELIGDGYLKDALELKKLLYYENDLSVLERLREIKYKNKIALSDYIAKTNGINIDTNSIFDVQIKRLHEYKRQLLNVLHILYLYNEVKANPNISITPRTFIFSAKASSGYMMAKEIIRLIVAASDLINSDPSVREKIRIVFLEDYKVTLAELIIPAAEISEQISMAGKEASGTGNMKLMINGAVTIGTLDGANIEIYENVGPDNIFLFGLTKEEVDDLWQRNYDVNIYLRENPKLNNVLNMLTSGILRSRFDMIKNSLTTNNFGIADAYMSIADFDSYVKAHEKIDYTYKDKNKFTKMSLINIANSGIFSADRAVKEYCDKIWSDGFKDYANLQ